MQIDDSILKKFEGQKVKHIKYGMGTITEINNNMLTIAFEGVDGCKKFRYPDAFEKFLSIDDAQLKATIEKDLQERSQENDFISHQKENIVYDHLRSLDKRRAEEQRIKMEEQREKMRHRMMMREQRANDTNNTSNTDNANNEDAKA